MDGKYLDLSALNIVQNDRMEADERPNPNGGFKYTKKKGNFFQCRLCNLYSINQNNERHCINPECKSNEADYMVKPLESRKIDMSLMISQQKPKKKPAVRGKEFERGRIPSFETVRLKDIHETIFKA